jgi:anti-sigma regulatory factor (Ser/Thr protein kinase)
VHHHFSCAADDRAPKQVRRQVIDVLGGAQLVGGEALSTIELLVSELATNVVLHGGPEISVDVVHDDHRVRVAIADDGPGMPVRRRPGSADDHGRGLGLVESASTAWGIRPTRQGKAVWFELPVVDAPPGPTS